MVEDPFDGGPHYGANREEITIVKNGRWGDVVVADKGPFNERALVGHKRDGEFRAVFSAFDGANSMVSLPQASAKALEVEAGEKVFASRI